MNEKIQQSANLAVKFEHSIKLPWTIKNSCGKLRDSWLKYLLADFSREEITNTER